jgi:hypothetical protein
MPYAPKIKTVSDHQIIDNVLAIVKRDFQAALDYFYPPAGRGGESLPDFAERTVGVFFNLTFPTFTIDPDRSGPLQSADGSYVEDSFRANLFLAVQDADAPTVTRLAMMYAAALESILRNASITDYTTGVTPGLIFALTTEVSYEYGLIGKNANGYEKPVSFELTLKFNER